MKQGLLTCANISKSRAALTLGEYRVYPKQHKKSVRNCKELYREGKDNLSTQRRGALSKPMGKAAYVATVNNYEMNVPTCDDYLTGANFWTFLYLNRLKNPQCRILPSKELGEYRNSSRSGWWWCLSINQWQSVGTSGQRVEVKLIIDGGERFSGARWASGDSWNFTKR